MPYINRKRRQALHEGARPERAGELNYLITAHCLDYLSQQDVRYNALNEIVGVLECVKQEFYRRMAAPYEDEAKQLEGDVYNTEAWPHK